MGFGDVKNLNDVLRALNVSSVCHRSQNSFSVAYLG